LLGVSLAVALGVVVVAYVVRWAWGGPDPAPANKPASAALISVDDRSRLAELSDAEMEDVLAEIARRTEGREIPEPPSASVDGPSGAGGDEFWESLPETYYPLRTFFSPAVRALGPRELFKNRVLNPAPVYIGPAQREELSRFVLAYKDMIADAYSFASDEQSKELVRLIDAGLLAPLEFRDDPALAPKIERAAARAQNGSVHLFASARFYKGFGSYEGPIGVMARGGRTYGTHEFPQSQVSMNAAHLMCENYVANLIAWFSAVGALSSEQCQQLMLQALRRSGH